MRKSVDERLEELDALAAGDASALLCALKKALRDRSSRVVAKAARSSADALLYELIPDLVSAYERFLDKPAKTDPSCFAKQAIARALVDLDCESASFYRAGLHYRQLEPVWGGSQDTAVDVRCSCAMGLVAAGDPRALVDLTELLHDPEAGARIGAARAIACGEPRQAELLLRAKVLAGDSEPEVVAECLAGLLSVAPDESLEFVAGSLSHPDETVRELAALALGESRLEAAVAWLKAAWDDVLPPPGFRRILLRAAVVNRTDPALEWLLHIIGHAAARHAQEALEALTIYSRNDTLRQRIEAALASRADAALTTHFERLWHP